MYLSVDLIAVAVVIKKYSCNTWSHVGEEGKLAENRKIETWRDPYGEGWSTCRHKEVTLNKGLTVLVGCNGAGKSTLLHNIQDVLRHEDTPYLSFDNQVDGNHNNTFGSAMMQGDLAFISTSLASSEGENITINIGRLLSQMQEFIKTGETQESKLHSALTSVFNDHEAKERKLINERWILLDAVDSGYSIDNVMDLKGVFDLIIADCERLGVDVYIVVSANEYELADGSPCLDVMEGKYITFDCYEKYKKFIMKTRMKKEKRYEKKNVS